MGGDCMRIRTMRKNDKS